MEIKDEVEVLRQQLEQERSARLKAEELVLRRENELAALRAKQHDNLYHLAQIDSGDLVVPALLYNLQHALLVTDAVGNILFVNKQFCSLFKLTLSPESLIGTSARLLESHHLFKAAGAHNMLATSGNALPVETFTLADGTSVEREFVPLVSEIQSCGSAWIYRNITSNSKQDHNQEEDPNPVIRLSYAGEILFVNAAGLKLLCQITKERVTAFKRLLLQKLCTLTDAKISNTLETYINGSHYLLFIVPVSEKGFVNYYFTDISERRRAELALQESENLIRNITRTIPNIVYTYDLEDDESVFYNTHIQTVLGYTQEDIALMDGQVFSTLTVPEDWEKLYHHVYKMMHATEGSMVEVEYRVVAKDGSVKHLLCRESVFKRRDNGQPKQIIGSAQDVTDLRLQSQALAKQKDFYESILNNVPSDIVVYNADKRFVFVNPDAVSDPDMRKWIFGKSNQEYGAFRNVPQERTLNREKQLDKALNEKVLVEFEEQIEARDGRTLHFIRRLNPVLDQNGDVSLVVGHGLSITELKVAQQAIVESEAKNRAILAAIPDLLFIIDTKGIVTDMNNVGQEHFSIPREEILGKALSKLLPRNLSHEVKCLIQRVIVGGAAEKIEYELNLNGSNKHYEIRFIKYNAEEVLAIVRDTTDERNAALEIKEKNEFIRLVLDSSPDLIYVKDGCGNFVMVNQEFANLLGRPKEEIIGKSNKILLPVPEDNQKYDTADQEVIINKTEVATTEKFTTSNGDVLWYNTFKRPLITNNGETHVLGISTNITKQRNASQQLEQSEELHRLLSENSRDIICLLNTDGTYQYVSKSVTEFLGYTQEELLLKSKQELIHPDDREKALQNGLLKSLKEKISTTVQHRKLKKNGEYVWVETNIKPIFDAAGEITKLQSATRDISHRRQYEQKLKHSEKKYRDLINYSQAYICTHDLEGHVISVNPYLLQMLGYAEEEMLGQKMNKFFPEQHKDNLDEYLAQFEGSNVVEGVLSILDKNKEERYLFYHNYKVEESNTDPYIIAIAQDITDRMQAERDLIEAKEAAEESARVKEHFLANMSHEIRTPMNGILGMADLLKKTSLDEGQKKYLHIIRQSADNLLVIINDILDVAKIEAGKLELESIPFDVTETVRATFQSLSYKAEEKDIVFSLEPFELKHKVIEGDPYRLTQILVNLLGNAIKFTDTGSVTLYAHPIKETHNDLTLRFSVKDTGIGIPDDKTELIFEGFTQAYTSTTRQYGGTGLGLSICKNLVEMQGGTIWVESTVGEGSSFNFELTYPKCLEHATLHEQQDEVDFKSLSNVRALLAEDNEVNVFLARSIMEGWGFVVDVAYNGQEALDLVEQNNYDIILMDIQMPVLSGVDATYGIRANKNNVKAGIPIIALTANALKGDAEKYLQAGMNAYLSKPFEEEKLFLKIAELIPHEAKVLKNILPEDKSEVIAPTPEPALYDLSIIEKMARGNEAFIKRTKQLFIETVPASVADLQEKYASADLVSVGAIAHKLKSTIDTMRIETLKTVVREIEQTSKSAENTPALAANINTLTSVLNQVVESLKADIA
ncbi:PAS domain-containing hybrid sensor histidine kinase/response regulator [Pontibacter harenae]|uniref:PAS domain-containing hybrid sensor histidine kinase/response regulator n=1 Tax=Pontibacter harenae TaxID=2894083 RepID=UPI001E5DE4F2|nr:PAS domain S-box protein [Pontibacter harenae]MCC9168250.1 PAS domain S-box protein [Pontibacter harenae]